MFDLYVRKHLIVFKHELLLVKSILTLQFIQTAAPIAGARNRSGCMTYTHTHGARNRFCEFSAPILKDNKPAGETVGYGDGVGCFSTGGFGGWLNPKEDGETATRKILGSLEVYVCLCPRPVFSNMQLWRYGFWPFFAMSASRSPGILVPLDDMGNPTINGDSDLSGLSVGGFRWMAGRLDQKWLRNAPNFVLFFNVFDICVGDMNIFASSGSDSSAINSYPLLQAGTSRTGPSSNQEVEHIYIIYSQTMPWLCIFFTVTACNSNF